VNEIRNSIVISTLVVVYEIDRYISKFYPLCDKQIIKYILRVPLVEQELLTLPEHLSSPPSF
jgi:hypothetical protein